MDNEKHILFFLNLSTNLPSYYYKLAGMFTQFNIQLVPIDAKDLGTFAQNQKIFLLMIIDSQGKKIQTDAIKVNSMAQLFRFNRIHLFEVSSFTPLFQERLGRGKVEKNYFYYSLPQAFNELVGEVIEDFFEANKVENVWPGGKRPKRQMDPGGILS
jgi:hypothetical protein